MAAIDNLAMFLEHALVHGPLEFVQAVAAKHNLFTLGLPPARILAACVRRIVATKEFKHYEMALATLELLHSDLPAPAAQRLEQLFVNACISVSTEPSQAALARNDKGDMLAQANQFLLRSVPRADDCSGLGAALEGLLAAERHRHHSNFVACLTGGGVIDATPNNCLHQVEPYLRAVEASCPPLMLVQCLEEGSQKELNALELVAQNAPVPSRASLRKRGAGSQERNLATKCRVIELACFKAASTTLAGLTADGCAVASDDALDQRFIFDVSRVNVGSIAEKIGFQCGDRVMDMTVGSERFEFNARLTPSLSFLQAPSRATVYFRVLRTFPAVA